MREVKFQDRKQGSRDRKGTAHTKCYQRVKLCPGQFKAEWVGSSPTAGVQETPGTSVSDPVSGPGGGYTHDIFIHRALSTH